MIRSVRLKVLFFLGVITLATLAVKYVNMINTVSVNKADRAMYRHDTMGKRFRYDLNSDLDLKASRGGVDNDKANLRSLLKDDYETADEDDDVSADDDKRNKVARKNTRVKQPSPPILPKKKSIDAEDVKIKKTAANETRSEHPKDDKEDKSKSVIKETKEKSKTNTDKSSKINKPGKDTEKEASTAKKEPSEVVKDKSNKVNPDDKKITEEKKQIEISNKKFDKTLVVKNKTNESEKKLDKESNTDKEEDEEELEQESDQEETDQEAEKSNIDKKERSLNKTDEKKSLKKEEPKQEEKNHQNSKKNNLDKKEEISSNSNKTSQKVEPTKVENQDSDKKAELEKSERNLNKTEDKLEEEVEEEESNQEEEPENIEKSERNLKKTVEPLKKEDSETLKSNKDKKVRSLNSTDNNKSLKKEDELKKPKNDGKISSPEKEDSKTLKINTDKVNQTKVVVENNNKPRIIKVEKENASAKRDKSKIVLQVGNKRISNIISTNASKTAPDWIPNLERIVHIDLKGAPPKPSYFKSFIPMLRKYGATGILIEYEDTFPFEGQLAEARYGFAYTKEDIGMIKQLAKENGLKIIPLVQTYGHLEWLLKLKKFAHLREDSQYPQVITPCLEESYTVLYDMLDQVIKVHQDSEYFHIGCDEVYYRLTNPKCADFPTKDFHKAFMGHLIKIATYVRSKMPNVKIMFWDDMMHGMPENLLDSYKTDINRLKIKPMMWGYMPRVEAYFPSQYYEKYGRIFGSIWIATAYKGAQGELATATKMAERLANHVSWVQVMRDKTAAGILKFDGVALTGWSRYDHFLPLCELLPQAIPHLTLALQVLKSGGALDDNAKLAVEKKLECNGRIRISYTDEASSPGVKCNFPGHEIYELVNQYESLIGMTQTQMKFSDLFMTPININYQYHHKKRSHEVQTKLKPIYTSMLEFKRKFTDACEPIYWNDTATEWLSVYLEPHLDRVYRVLDAIRNESTRIYWLPRPLPIKLKTYPKTVV